MSQQNDLWSLFLLAMERFLAGPQDEMLSFYQVATIHYLPTQSWNNVAGLVNWGGYCTHNSNLFGIWHRPYIALVEQIMHMHATDIVDEMSPGWQQNDYKDALLRLRFPYWDWATKSVNGQIVPSVVETPTVTVFYLNGTAVQISNPLYQYQFSPSPPSFYGAVDSSYGPALPYSEMGYTVRHATTNSSTATTDNTDLELQFQSLYSSLTSRLNAIFTINQTFNQFSNYGDDLKPFYMSSDGAFWTANAARDIGVFNYTYGEVQNYTDSASMQRQAQLIYPASTAYPTTTSTAMTDMDSMDSSQVLTETYFVQVNMSRSAIGGSYGVDFFVGDVPSDPNAWRKSPSYIGSATAPYMPMPPGFSMDDLSTETSKNMVMLTQALQDAVQNDELEGMDEGSVVAFLKGNLRWRVVKNNVEIPVYDVPDLSVVVSSTEVRPATQGAGAQWIGPIVQHPEIQNS
ncbi:Di-copper centre-containing protein [Saccharata proteae CBS 121410]|uniref:Di-copper centre-containing protein n=1 Tax=Saccharata proteae CBS 121410 TaxID=1314787 RepID=A0A9P4LRN6_9PEZI|nr:Di-copper centre-containing protein [Saccharata proteae CBS 121410]